LPSHCAARTFELELIPVFGHLSLGEHRLDEQLAIQLLRQIKEEVQELFRL
jgi:hypothetical protein